MADSTLDWALDARDGGWVAAPRGRVDETTADAFAAHLGAGVAAASGRLIVDLSGVDYMSSRGLRALTVAQRKGKEASVEIRLAAPNDIMREILAISRYDKIFGVFASVTDALAS